ncbi:MAG: HAMP domain-containing protein, partial [Bacteroidota bacterium]
MSVANKIIVSSTLVALLAAFAGFLAWKNMRSIRGVYTTKVAAYHEISRDISRTQVHITQLISNGSEASPGELARREVRSAPAYAGLREALDRYGARVPAGEGRDWRPAVEAYFGYLEATETAWEASVWRERSTTLVTALEALRDWEYAECQAVGEVVTGQWRRLLRSVIIVSLLTFLLAIIFGQLIARGLSQALWALQGAAQRLGEGDFSIRVDRVGEQELDKLGDTFRSLASDLEKAQIIERQNEALAHLNHQLKRKNDSLDSFAYRVSHDLKAPVVNLQFFGRLVHVKQRLLHPLVLFGSQLS